MHHTSFFDLDLKQLSFPGIHNQEGGKMEFSRRTFIKTLGLRITGPIAMAMGFPIWKHDESSKKPGLDALTDKEAPKASGSVKAIVFPEDHSIREFIAAKEVRRYIYLTTGRRLPLLEVNSIPVQGDLILIAEGKSKLIAGLQRSLNYKLNPDGFLIKTVEDNSRRILVIAGYDPLSTLYGAYRFAEHLGVDYDLTSDIIPDKKMKLSIADFDEVGEPLLARRGIIPFHDFPEGPDLWNTEGYRTVISQLTKLGMNFIGLHTYPKYSGTSDKDNNIPQGPEPTVWIGTMDDMNPDGTVKWSYQSYYADTDRPGRIWGFAEQNTDRFHCGSSQLFESNAFGADVFNGGMPSGVRSSNDVFNRTGEMFRKAFTHAKILGVKTAVGTELPLGMEPKGPDVAYEWIRGIPPELQVRLNQKGTRPADPSTVKALYKGIFERIKRTHPLDYYWLWSWEGWVRHAGSGKQINAFKREMEMAYQALHEVDAPFQLGLAGWMIGAKGNPAEFDNTLPPEVPFFGLWPRARGFEDIKSDRIKWAGTWFEEDWGLLQPQLNAGNVYDDIKAALDKECNGIIANHWRTRIMSPNLKAMRKLLWVYGQTDKPPQKKLPEDQRKYLNELYLEWATRRFGREIAQEAAAIFTEIQTKSGSLRGASPDAILDWETDEKSNDNAAPAAIMSNPKSWKSERSKYESVIRFENLRNRIVGKGNLNRFDYWLNAFKCYRLMAEYGTVRHRFEEAAENGKWETALGHRKEMARLYEKVMLHEIQKVSNSSDLGEIINLEILNWHQLVVLKWDKRMTKGLGEAIPDDANPSMQYNGQPLMTVDSLQTSLDKHEPLNLKVRAMGNPDSISLFYRPLGTGNFKSAKLNHIARGVFQLRLQPQKDDFEFYLRADLSQGNLLYPETAPDINQTVIVMG